MVLPKMEKWARWGEIFVHADPLFGLSFIPSLIKYASSRLLYANLSGLAWLPADIAGAVSGLALLNAGRQIET